MALAQRLSAAPPTTSRLSYGPYELGELLGEGGAARVRAATGARDPMGRDVAVKTLLPELLASAGHLRALQREAYMLACLDHPGVVRFVDQGFQDGEYLVVMERVHGASVGRLMNAMNPTGERLPLATALYVGLRVLDALEHVHRTPGRGGGDIVHRDVSPGNIMVGKDGSVKLIDFGIASWASVFAEPPRRLSGKIGYHSPEQARGQRTDVRSDVFSLAVVLAEMILHCRFYPGSSPMETLRLSLAADQTTLERAAGRLPPELRHVLVKALALDPARRFGSAREMRDAVTACVRREGLPVATAADVGRWVAGRTAPPRSGVYPRVDPAAQERPTRRPPVVRAVRP